MGEAELQDGADRRMERQLVENGLTAQEGEAKRAARDETVIRQRCQLHKYRKRETEHIELLHF